MRKLTEETLAEALAVCCAKPCVNVGIVFPSEDRKTKFARELEKEVRGGQVPSALYLFDINELWFESASNISMISAHSARRKGRKYDIILYDEQVSDDVLEELGYCERPTPMKRDSLSKYFQWSFGAVDEEKAESPELDEFLGNFRVNEI